MRKLNFSIIRSNSILELLVCTLFLSQFASAMADNEDETIKTIEALVANCESEGNCEKKVDRIVDLFDELMCNKDPCRSLSDKARGMRTTPAKSAAMANYFLLKVK